MAAVTISYPEVAVREECLIEGELKGFGQLHPRTQGVETLGKSIISFHGRGGAILWTLLLCYEHYSIFLVEYNSELSVPLK